MSNPFIIALSTKEDIPLDQLETIWDEAQNEVKSSNPDIIDTDMKFTNMVIEKVKEKVKKLDLLKVKEHLMSNENFKKHGQEWLNSLASENYVKAQDDFKKVTEAKLKSLINNKSKDILKNFAEKINSKK